MILSIYKTSKLAKGLALIFMYVHHLFTCGKAETIEFLLFSPAAARRVAVGMKLCVALFVFLTAYGITAQHRIKKLSTTRDISCDTVSRYIKLMCNYWVIFFISLAITCLLRNPEKFFGSNIYDIAFWFLSDFLGLSYLFGVTTLNPTWWYMSVAIILIVIMPLLICFVKKFGAFISLSLVVLFPAIIDYRHILSPYMLAATLGICFSQYGLFEKCFASITKKTLYKILTLIFCVSFISCTIWFRETIGILYYITDAISAALVCFVCCLYIGKTPLLNTVLEFIGRHSANLFLIHTFIYNYWLTDFIFAPKYSVLVLSTLLITTLLISFVLEKIKKLLHFDKGVKFLVGKANKLVCFVMESSA
ncbi:MAG: acyltransferase family protein [Oscillospiraceae bacterium]